MPSTKTIKQWTDSDPWQLLKRLENRTPNRVESGASKKVYIMDTVVVKVANGCQGRDEVNFWESHGSEHDDVLARIYCWWEAKGIKHPQFSREPSQTVVSIMERGMVVRDIALDRGGKRFWEKGEADDWLLKHEMEAYRECITKLRRLGIGDLHDSNLAFMPDGTVKCIDYGLTYHDAY
jgi:hypothetical protein